MALASPHRALPHLRGDIRAPGAGFPGIRPLLVQVLLVAGAALCYFAVRGLTQSGLAVAQEHGRDVLAVERRLGLDWEAAAQDLVIDHDVAVRTVNAVYMYGHWPVIALTLGWLFVRRPNGYVLLRNAMFASGAIGLVVFALMPVAPPRLGVLELVDTITRGTSEYRTLQPPGLINRYAALPSLHFGWNMIVGIVVWQATTNRLLRAAALALPVALAFAVVATANHYVLDVIAGGIVALVGLVVAQHLPTAVSVPRWRRSPG